MHLRFKRGHRYKEQSLCEPENRCSLKPMFPGARSTATALALWPNWIRHRSTDPEIAGSSPARVGIK